MKLKNLKFRKLKINEYDLFKDYYRKNLDKKNIFIKDKKIFNWHFRDADRYNFFISINKNKICSIQGFIPQSKYDPKLSKKQIFLSNFHAKQDVLPGLGSVAFKKLINDKVFVGSTNFPLRMLGYHKKLGFKTGKMDHLFIISPFKKKFNIIEVNSKDKLKIKKIWKKPGNYPDITFKEIKDIKKIKLNLKVFKKFKPEKSKKFLKNRYLTYPYFKYYCYEIYKNNKAVAIIIFRKLENKGNNIIKIIDYIGEDQNLKFINKLLIYLMKKFESECIDFYSFGIEQKYFKDTPFLNIINYQDIIIPEWFNPFLKKNIDYHYAIKCLNNSSIRLFKGDGDRDRIN